MNFRVLLSITCLFGILVGLLMLLSPFFVTGGYVGWRDNVRPGGVEHLFAIAISIVMGIAVMIGSGICAVVFGVIFGIEATSKIRSKPPIQGQTDASGVEVGPKSDQANNRDLTECRQHDDIG